MDIFTSSMREADVLPKVLQRASSEPLGEQFLVFAGQIRNL